MKNLLFHPHLSLKLWYWMWNPNEAVLQPLLHDYISYPNVAVSMLNNSNWSFK